MVEILKASLTQWESIFLAFLFFIIELYIFKIVKDDYMVVIWLYWRKPSDSMNVFLEERGCVCVCPELNPGPRRSSASISSLSCSHSPFDMTLWERRRDKNAHKLCHKIASLECLDVPVMESRKVMFRYSDRWSYILPNVSVEILASVLQNRTVLGERAIGKGQRVNVIGVLICMIQISHFIYIIHIWIIYIYSSSRLRDHH